MKLVNIYPKDLVSLRLNSPSIDPKNLKGIKVTERVIFDLLMNGHKVEEILSIEGKEVLVPLNIDNYKLEDPRPVEKAVAVDNSSKELAEAKKELSSKNSQLSTLNNKVNQLSNVISQRDKKITELSNAIKEKDKKIAELEKELESVTDPQ